MAFVRKSGGTRVRVTEEEVWGKPPTKEEMAARADAALTAELDAITDKANDPQRAVVFLLADFWQAANPGMNPRQARAAVRDRLRKHLSEIKGI